MQGLDLGKAMHRQQRTAYWANKTKVNSKKIKKPLKKKKKEISKVKKTSKSRAIGSSEEQSDINITSNQKEKSDLVLKASLLDNKKIEFTSEKIKADLDKTQEILTKLELENNENILNVNKFPENIDLSVNKEIVLSNSNKNNFFNLGSELNRRKVRIIKYKIGEILSSMIPQFLKNLYLNLKLRLNKVKINKTLSKFLNLILIILILFSILFYFTVNANPGDLLFTLKGFYEQKQLSLNKGNEERYYLNVLKDRVNAVNSFAKTNNCLQVLIAQDEVASTVKTIRLGNYDKKDISEIITTLKTMNGIQTVCNISDSVRNLFSFYTYVDFNNWDVTKQKIELMVRLSSLKNRYDDLDNQIKLMSISTQQSLNQINSLLLVSKQAIDSFSNNANNTSNYLTYRISFDAADLSLNTLNSYLKSTTITQSLNFESTVQAICLVYSDNKICSNNGIQSNWNSIYSRINLGEQINLGESNLLTYLALAFPVKNLI